MVAFLLGGASLVAILVLLGGFAHSDVKALTKGLRYAGAALLLLSAIGLAALDRVGLAMLAGSFAWALFTGGHAWPRSGPFGGTWREPGPGKSDSAMSRAEALEVLGLAQGASESEIAAAYKRLILQNHPDRGGSTYLAAKINQAKDVLLGG